MLKVENSLDRQEVIRVLQERERLGSTGIGEGVAIPHGKLKDLKRLLISFGRSRSGVDFDSMDGKPAHLFFLLVAPEESVGVHLKTLARISKLLKNPAGAQTTAGCRRMPPTCIRSFPRKKRNSRTGIGMAGLSIRNCLAEKEAGLDLELLAGARRSATAGPGARGSRNPAWRWPATPPICTPTASRFSAPPN